MKRILIIIVSAAALLIAANAQTEIATSGPRLARATCVEECQKRNREEVKLCNVLNPPDTQPTQHRTCLDKAKTKFDACVAACQ